MPPQGLTLAIYPTSRGFGWAALHGPLAPYKGGLVEVANNKNAVCIRKARALLDAYRPDALVFESFEARNSSRTTRITKLCRALVGIAMDLGIDYAIYTRAEIAACFASVGAGTREEIAEAVARHLPALSPRLPDSRRSRSWKGEDRRMALFASAALVLTHYRQEALSVLEQQLEAA